MRKYFYLALGVLLLAGGMYLVWGKRSAKTMTLRLATGKLTKPPNRMTQFFLDHAGRQGLNIELINVAGTEETLDLVSEGKIDAALVKAGIQLDAGSPVRQITALDLEVFHLLVRHDLAARAAQDLSVLRGLRININKPETGTHSWAKDIFDFVGLEAKRGDYVPAQLDNPDLLQLASRLQGAAQDKKTAILGESPEAIFYGGPLPSDVPQQLLRTGGYRLVPLSFAKAYLLARKRQGFVEPSLDPRVALEATTIPAFLYGFSPPAPAEDQPSLGIRRLVIAHEQTPPEAVYRLLRLIYESPQTGALDPVELDKLQPEYELHSAVSAYIREQALPSNVMRFLERFGGVAGAIGGGLLALWGYWRWRRLLRFEKFFQDVQQVEQKARSWRQWPAAEQPGRLLQVREELTVLRAAVVQDFAAGQFQGEGLVLTLFTLIRHIEESLPPA